VTPISITDCLYPIVAKAQDAVSPPDNGIFVSLRKASKGDAVVDYREPLATKELRYHGLVSGGLSRMHTGSKLDGVNSVDFCLLISGIKCPLISV
jgi:hypothetical protein